MFACALFITPRTSFCFKATESKVEPQLNSNGAAIKRKSTENQTWLWECSCTADFIVSLQDLTSL